MRLQSAQRNRIGLLTAWLLLCSAATGQTIASGSLSGRLTDLYSTAVPSATIVLRNLQTGTEVCGLTARNGTYRFSGLEPGSYRLEALSPQRGRGHVEGIVVFAGHESKISAALLFAAVPPSGSAALARTEPVPTPMTSVTAAPLAGLQHNTHALYPVVNTISTNASVASLELDALVLAPRPLTLPESVPVPVEAALNIMPLHPVDGFVPGMVIGLAGGAAMAAIAIRPSSIPTPAPELADAVLTGEQLQALPLSGRHWEALARDTQGTETNIDVAQNDDLRAGVAVPGGVRMDGVGQGSAFGGTHRGLEPVVASAPSSEAAIKEVLALDSSDASASDGTSLSVKTRSGGFGLHGQAFVFGREKMWGARNPFAQWVKQTAPGTNTTVPTFTASPYAPGDQRVTWGAGTGGSLWHGRMFWFAALDAEQRDYPAVATVKHPENFFAQPANDEMQVLSARLGLSSSNPVGEGVKAYSQMLETLTGLMGPAPRSSALWTGFGRIDVRAGERHRFSIEDTGTQWDSPGGGLTRTSVAYGANSLGSPSATSERIAGRWDAFLTENLLATTAGAYRSYTYKPRPEKPSTYENSLLANLWGQLPQIAVDNRYGMTIGNLARFGPGNYPQEWSTDFEEHLDWVHRRLLLKSGFEWRHDQEATSVLRNHTGTYVYSRLVNFASDALVFAKYGMADALNPMNQHNCDQRGRAWRDSTGQLHGLGYLPCYSYYTQTLGPTEWNLSTNDFAGWTTAQWQPAKSLVLSTALRWDRQQLPPPMALVNNPDLPLTQRLPALGSEWGARASLAWGVREGYWPVLRMGYGGYYGRTDNAVLMTVLTQTGSLKGDLQYFFRPTDNLAGGGAPPFPYAYAGQPANAVKPGAVEFGDNYRNVEIHQAQLTIEEALPGRVLVSVAAHLSLGRRLPVTQDMNIDAVANPGTMTYAVVDPSQKGPIKAPQITVPFFASWPSTGSHNGRASAQYQQIAQLTSRANSTYEALQLRISRSTSRGLSFRARYTYGHAWDWNPNETSAITSSSLFDPTDFSMEHGRSDLDVRHSVSGWVIWEAPWRRKRSQNWWANGWRVSAVGQYRSGIPYTMRTAGAIPELFTMSDATIAGLGPGMNGYGGDNRVYGVGRNTYRYPATWKMDLRAGRRFALGPRRELELLAESFNLFNHQNVTQLETVGYTISNGDAYGSLPTLNFLSGEKTGRAEFGQPLDINGTDWYRERQIDFGLRLRFKVAPVPQSD